MPVLEARKLTVTIGGNTVCRELSFRIEPGQSWGLLGANGVGKTTLLHTLAGLRAPASGEVRLDGEPIASLPRRQVAIRLGLLPQDSADALPSTVLETALIGRHPHLSAWQWESAEDIALAQQALAAVELSELAARAVDTLSGGERRRLAIATLLTQAPAVYLLDEPANHLDLRHQVGLLALLREHAGNGALLMSLHDLNLAARFCDHLLLLFGDGEALAAPAEEALTASNLTRLYGHPITVIESGNWRAYVPL